MKLGEAHIIQGNALDLPLPNNSVDLICTSPPYFGLRSYQDGCIDCANNNKNNMRGYMERYCPGCGKNPNRNVCPDCGLTTLRTEETKAALRKQTANPDCPTCGGTGKGHYDGQIGSEATPAEFLDALIAATREMVRVLKPTGSIFVNLGDKYNSAASGQKGDMGAIDGRSNHDGNKWVNDYRKNERGTVSNAVRVKSLFGIPWRYAIRCIDDLGLILRAEIIWNKPNGLPESVTDRVRRSHEQWFHFTKQPRYFSAIDEIREPQNSLGRGRPWSNDVEGSVPTWGVQNGSQGLRNGGRTTDQMNALNPLGKLPGSVWIIPTQPLTVPPELGIDHFAAYPMEWPRRIIQGWTPNGVCTVCGQGRRPTVAKDYLSQTIPGEKLEPHTWKGDLSNPRERAADGTFLPRENYIPPGNLKGRGPQVVRMGDGAQVAITGYMCGCPDATAPTTPSVILDPFGGTGTTALVAKALGRIGISVDLSHDYCRMAVWRTNDPGELASALQVEKPEPVPDGQVALF